MKSIRHALIGTTGSLCLLTVLGQDPPKPVTDRPSPSDRVNSADRTNRLTAPVKASEVVGMAVRNYQDEKLGKVEDLAIDVESGRVVQVILSLGGIIGIGDALVAVPPGALHHDAAQKILHLDADQNKLKSAPKFDNANWAECCDSNRLSQVYHYYGQESAYRFVDQKGEVRSDQRKLTSVPNPSPDVTTRTGSNINRSLIPTSRLAQLQKATTLMGTSVKNLQDESLGKVENLLLDLPSGRVVAVIVSSGGFLGIGDELSAMPPAALQFAPDRRTLQLDASKEMLGNAPHFKANQWPDFAEPTYTDNMYRAYQLDPHLASDGGAAPDNSERNVRDRNDQTLTPLDQGNSKADVDITAQIRKQIVAAKNMSINAQNVKIITSNGRVTLRGPVNTAEEKRAIDEIAKSVAGANNVDNQLEVK